MKTLYMNRRDFIYLDSLLANNLNINFIMKKELQIVPSDEDIKYISDWKDYDLPRGHVIVDKGVTGCGYTEYTLTNNAPVVLCSPRKLLLENKRDQHKDDINILYLENDITDIKSINHLKTKIKNHIFLCDEENLPIKFMVTYDSSHYVIDILKEMNLLGDFRFIVDEFQSIFLDSYFKSDVEFDFVEYLQDCPNVLYLSATPMLDKYLEKLDTFKDLKFYKLDWSQTGIVENIVIQRKFTRSLTGECIKIIENYLNHKFPSAYTTGIKIVFSEEAVFYFNSISDIIRVINKTRLTSDQVNIICSDLPENREKLGKIGHNIGKIPLKNEKNKMFTFCTKSAYIGADFYSNCASTYVFADPNIKSLALDISLDLPQIVGRQRDKSNPFKNDITIFYRTIRKNEVQDRALFDLEQDGRRKETQTLLTEFEKMSAEGKTAYLQKLKRDSELYLHDFVGISKKTGKPVYNSFIEIANERSWEVSQVDYQDKISVTKSLESISSNVSEYKSDFEKDIQKFLDQYFYKTGVFEKKMRMYCEFMDIHCGDKDVEEALRYRIKDPRFRKYYRFYGTKGCKTKQFKEKSLELGMINVSKTADLSSVIYTRFKSGDKLTKKEIKSILQELCRSLDISSKPKATDLGKYFNLERIRIKQQEGYLLKDKIPTQ